MDFVKGNWYKGSDRDLYIKVSYFEQCDGYKRIYYTEKVSNYGGKYTHDYKDDYWASIYLEGFALSNPVTQEELITVLPQGHPDLNINQSYEIY